MLQNHSTKMNPDDVQFSFCEVLGDDDRGIMRDANGKKTKPAGGVLYSLDFVQNVKAMSAWLKAKSGVK